MYGLENLHAHRIPHPHDNSLAELFEPSRHDQDSTPRQVRHQGMRIQVLVPKLSSQGPLYKWPALRLWPKYRVRRGPRGWTALNHYGIFVLQGTSSDLSRERK